jgi:hypothetical protein
MYFHDDQRFKKIAKKKEEAPPAPSAQEVLLKR